MQEIAVGSERYEAYRKAFISFIFRQLQQMTLEDLRETYDTTSTIVDKRKGAQDERGVPLYPK